jgi:protein gp37
MSTRIEWADEVWNPVTGCSPVSEGCDNCYARRMAQSLRGRFGYDKHEPFRVTVHPDRLAQPLRWKKPRRILVCSMGDLFHDDVKVSTILDVWQTMRAAKQHRFLVLTKRPRRMDGILNSLEWTDDGEAYLLAGPGSALPLENVWLGVSVENQRTANERIPIMLETAAAHRFVSVEPMLEPITFDVDFGDMRIGFLGGEIWREDYQVVGNKIDCVIVGGETGAGARPMDPEWARSIRDQCKLYGVPFFLKQMAGRAAISEDLMVREGPEP